MFLKPTFLPFFDPSTFYFCNWLTYFWARLSLQFCILEIFDPPDIFGDGCLHLVDRSGALQSTLDCKFWRAMVERERHKQKHEVQCHLVLRTFAHVSGPSNDLKRESLPTFGWFGGREKHRVFQHFRLFADSGSGFLAEEHVGVQGPGSYLCVFLTLYLDCITGAKHTHNKQQH